jgi:hypothetical protein
MNPLPIAARIPFTFQEIIFIVSPFSFLCVC